MTKVAHKLNQRADLDASIAEKVKYVQEYANAYEGDPEPSQDVDQLLEDALGDILAHSDLTMAINLSNAHTDVEIEGEEMSVVDAVTYRGALKRQAAVIDLVLGTSRASLRRWGRAELNSVRNIDEARWLEKLRELRKRIRVIDGALQESNWTTNI